MRAVKSVKRLFEKLDSTTKAALAVIGLYLFLYVFIDFVEVVSTAILRYIFL